MLRVNYATLRTRRLHKTEQQLSKKERAALAEFKKKVAARKETAAPAAEDTAPLSAKAKAKAKAKADGADPH